MQYALNDIHLHIFFHKAKGNIQSVLRPEVYIYIYYIHDVPFFQYSLNFLSNQTNVYCTNVEDGNVFKASSSLLDGTL